MLAIADDVCNCWDQMAVVLWFRASSRKVHHPGNGCTQSSCHKPNYCPDQILNPSRNWCQHGDVTWMTWCDKPVVLPLQSHIERCTPPEIARYSGSDNHPSPARVPSWFDVGCRLHMAGYMSAYPAWFVGKRVWLMDPIVSACRGTSNHCKQHSLLLLLYILYFASRTP